jgi:glycosyltransferase involved in cell wall biosynthesis
MNERRVQRVLAIHTTLEERGGAETHFLSEINSLRSMGYEVFVFSFADAKPDADDAHTLRYAEPRSRWLRKAFKFTFHPGAYLSLRRYVRRIQPDVVHLHMNTKYPLAVLFALRGYPVLQTIHSNGMFCPTGWLVHADDLEVCSGGAGLKCVRHGCVPLHRLPLHRLLELAWHALAKRTISAFITPSRHLGGYLERFEFAPVTRIPNFSPVSVGEPSPLPRDSELILYVGVLTRQKGVNTLLEAMPTILEHRPDARLVVVGDGPEAEPLRALAGELGVRSRVEFAGKVPNRELPRYYAAARACAIPSLWLENSPVVAYEAMLAGRPIVGSDRGGIPDLIESAGCGFVVQAKDPKAIAERIGQLLSDPELAERLGRNGRRYASEAVSKQAFYERLTPLMEAVAASCIPAQNDPSLG